MELEELYPDLAPLVKGASFTQLFRLFHALALVRYATKDQLNSVNSKIATKKKLTLLVDMGYLFLTNTGAYFTAPKTLELLKERGFNTKILQKKLTGEGAEHQLQITSVILGRMKFTDFYSVFYPTFKQPPDYDKEYLRPDACLIRKNESAYKITFLEVENPKVNWTAYLADKKEKYDKVAQDYNTYDKWWRYHSDQLNLPFCREEDFCFSVLCVGGFRAEWEGWEFSHCSFNE